MVSRLFCKQNSKQARKQKQRTKPHPPENQISATERNSWSSTHHMTKLRPHPVSLSFVGVYISPSERHNLSLTLPKVLLLPITACLFVFLSIENLQGDHIHFLLVNDEILYVSVLIKQNDCGKWQCIEQKSKRPLSIFSGGIMGYNKLQVIPIL